ncbi:MAG TPA: hypothetical protein VMT23_00770 [Candidatus Binatia bacterium]|nr:hypothetical protein [Candidatus Binatia bacterium]
MKRLLRAAGRELLEILAAMAVALISLVAAFWMGYSLWQTDEILALVMGVWAFLAAGLVVRVLYEMVRSPGALTQGDDVVTWGSKLFWVFYGGVLVLCLLWPLTLCAFGFVYLVKLAGRPRRLAELFRDIWGD